MSSRRQFLKLMAGIAASGLTGTFAASGQETGSIARDKKSFAVAPWQGDNYVRGHQLRDAQIPPCPDRPDRTADVVIVGGGMAGLAAAHYLKDTDFLLLEQYANPGGTSSGGSYRGIDYSQGAVCTGTREGLAAQLFDDLGITPAIISPEDTSWHYGGNWQRAISGNDSFHTDFKRLTAEARKARGSHREGLANLDEITFSQCLSGYNREFMSLVNNLCRSFFCADASYVTAAAGFFMVNALTTNSYVFDGGNSGIARALSRRLLEQAPDRLLTEAFVWQVSQKNGGASVVYTDAQGQCHRIDCRHAIVTVPPLVAARIIHPLPNELRQSFNQLEYGAFVVANFCMPEKILHNPYQSFADEPYPFCQMVMAEAPYIATGRYRQSMGSVLTVYHPYEHGTAGRAKLLIQRENLVANSLIADLSKLLGPIEDKIDQVVLTRWGHAMIVPRPGTSRVLSQAGAYDAPWMTYAHSSANGGPSLEGALLSANKAALRCLQQRTR